MQIRINNSTLTLPEKKKKKRVKAIEGVNKFWRRKLIMSCSDAGKFFDIFSLIPKSNIILSLSPPPPPLQLGKSSFSSF